MDILYEISIRKYHTAATIKKDIITTLFPVITTFVKSKGNETEGSVLSMENEDS